ncbi:SusD/RagB family nutrient-binding outer membrane lipoprotein [Sphingobacterium sp. LRF_L2]|uniref:SusD/RagB family nutrient-binding outer membrane lipoprotein n=1 Tax=Sphingobacterium sp. LRF_L2 TaxID=3369421 RepID=UPI003F63E4BE
MRKRYFAVALLALQLMGCSKFEEINTNPETPAQVRSSMIATRVILSIADQPGQKDFMRPYFLTKAITWGEMADQNYQFNALGTQTMSLIGLNDVQYMVDYAGTEKLKNAYQGLMHFARAYRFYELTMALGDIPYHDALVGESEQVYFPKYDTQKEVFLGILNELEQADEFFAAGDKFDGDPMFAGDLTKWRKLANSFELNVLLQLSKKVDDVDLKVKERFNAIFTGKPIFQSSADNFQLIRSDNSGQTYPFYKVGNNNLIYPIVSDEIIDRLKASKDRRLFYYAKPSPVKIAAGLSATNYDAYVGISPSLTYGDLSTVRSTNDYSKLGDRYTELPTGEPTQQYSYAHMCFVIAEAATRGWISESDVNWYKKGIEAAMSFVVENTTNTEAFHQGMPMDETYIANAVNEYGTKFPTTLEGKIEAIITQKFLASFLQGRITPYYDYRRTGYPKWKINPASSLNVDAPEKIPTRWMYPAIEFAKNSENVSEAIKRQYDGVDDPNQLMWILK